jgi:hypothetical protein
MKVTNFITNLFNEYESAYHSEYAPEIVRPGFAIKCNTI